MENCFTEIVSGNSCFVRFFFFSDAAVVVTTCCVRLHWDREIKINIIHNMFYSLRNTLGSENTLYIVLVSFKATQFEPLCQTASGSSPDGDVGISGGNVAVPVSTCALPRMLKYSSRAGCLSILFMSNVLSWERGRCVQGEARTPHQNPARLQLVMACLSY